MWHGAPDGGATFGSGDAGWIYVSNSEIGNSQGGAGAILFDSSGDIVDAYPVLLGSSNNCAGGATTWGTWLSCEERDNGVVWECDPTGTNLPIQRPALEIFAHEAASLDTINNIIYMTEDKSDGCLYRYVPITTNGCGVPDLSSGSLEVAVINPQSLIVDWIAIPDPGALSQPTRFQIMESMTFAGDDGIIYYDGKVSFATKGDNRIWSYNTVTNALSVAYDAASHPNPILTGVDNITLSKDGELVVAEGGGNMQIVAILASGRLVPLVQIVGHTASEVTGPVFSPDGKRLYFSLQRGITGLASDGITYEITGPYHL